MSVVGGNVGVMEQSTTVIAEHDPAPAAAPVDPAPAAAARVHPAPPATAPVDLDPSAASQPGDLLDAIVSADRMLASLTAMRAELVELARQTMTEPGSEISHRSFRAELAAALRIPERTADRIVGEASVWSDRLPATLAALRDGAITPRHARIIADQTTGLDADATADLERRALGGSWRSTGEFARFVRRMRERRSPEQAAERHRRAAAERFVGVDAGDDGMAWLTAHLPLVEAAAIDDRLDALARGLRRDGDSRTLGQARADALVDVLLDRPTADARRFAGIASSVILTVPATTVAGIGDEPGELVGYGPVDPDTARRLLAVAPHFRRMLTDPDTGVALSLGRTRYRPTDDMRLWARVRDQLCSFTGCTRPAAECDLDHRDDWAAGGDTAAANLQSLCRGHHILKHETEWSAQGVDADGTTHWRSPAGRDYRSSTAMQVGADPP